MVERKKVLIAYFSWSGNTKIIARQLHQLVGGDIFEIQRSEDYPAIYNTVLNIAKKEIRCGDKPELKDKLASIEKYSTVFIGFPNWWNTFPAPVLTFLSEYDFSGKTIIPFCTHGGSGIGESVANIVKQCPKADVHNALSIYGNDVNKCNAVVEKWVNKELNTSIGYNGK